MRKLLGIAVLSVAAGFGVLASSSAAASPATDADVSPQAVAPACGAGLDLCLWWNRNFEASSAVAGFTFNEWDHLVYSFPRNGQGGGSAVGNNSASFWNSDGNFSVTVYYNPSSNGTRPSGPNQFYAQGQSRNCAQAGPNICNNNRANFWN